MNRLFGKNSRKLFVIIVFTLGSMVKALIISCFFMLCFLAILKPYAFAAHPLITDDAGTLGKAKMQFELNGEYAADKEDGATAKATEIAVGFAYGILDGLDLWAGLPYVSWSNEEEGVTEKEKGISDASIGAKWAFYEIKQFSFALKPGISLPTGDEKKGLGTGKIGYQCFLINTITFEPFAFHINLGYMRNENKLEEEKNLWHVSAACEYSILKNLRLVANIGMEKNPDKEASDNPAFLLGGVIFSLNDNFDLDGGFKYGLNKPEDDYCFLAGVTVKL